MKKYKVTIWLMFPHQEYSENPATKKVTFEVEAKSEYLAYKEAEKLNKSMLSVWNYKAKEIK